MIRLAALAMVLLVAGCGCGQTAVQPSPASEKPGPLGDTWAWNGKVWHAVSALGPAPRYAAAMAYDTARGEYVLFGGQSANGSSDETWTFDGMRWRRLAPPHKPSPRRGAAMGYDPMHSMVVMYGGITPDQAEGHEVGDTWTWNGADWTEVGKDPGPPGQRQNAAMATAGSDLVLFGGNAANVSYYADVWSWNGTTWSSYDREPRPAGRSGAAVVWDPSSHSLFVLGGVGFNSAGGPGAQGSPLGDAWWLTGSRWSPLGDSGPAPLSFGNAIWNGVTHSVVVLFGMRCPHPSAAVWGWDGNIWSQLAVTGAAARWGAASAQDGNGNALVFGGSSESGC